MRPVVSMVTSSVLLRAGRDRAASSGVTDSQGTSENAGTPLSTRYTRFGRLGDHPQVAGVVHLEAGALEAGRGWASVDEHGAVAPD